jgi:hypothetical protein
VNNASADCFSFADFEQSLKGLSAEDLMKTMRTFLSKGVAACQRGFEKATEEAKTSLEKEDFWKTRTDAWGRRTRN